MAAIDPAAAGSGPVGRLRRASSRPLPVEPLVFFRLVFGGLMVWEATRYLENGWVKRLWIDPGFHFKYLGFGWVEPWPGDGMLWHVAGLGVLGALIAVGLAYRAAAALFFLGFAYVFLLDQATYLNHFYLVVLLAGIAPCLWANRAFSLDVWRTPRLESPVAPAWQLMLLRAQVAVVYGFAGVAKLNADWLHGQPLALWLASRAARGDVPDWLATREAALALSYGGLAFDLLVVPALLWRRTRTAAFALAVLFHATNAWLFSIGIFPWLMIGLTALFFPAEAFARLASRARRRRRERTPPAALSPLGRAACAVLVLYAAVQVVVPLRHWLYPGDVAWTEEGHRFAWRMKLRDKTGAARFDVLDARGARLARVDPGDYLNRSQVHAMAVRPDLVQQFARFLAEDHQRRGYGAVEVRARARVRLNGRPARDLVDGTWNLAAAPRGLQPAAWILP